MLSQWYRSVRLPMSFEDFRKLPRSAVYGYEYLDGEAVLTPQPRTYNAVLALTPRPAPTSVAARREVIGVRRLHAADWPRLPAVFAEAFRGVQPFAGLSDADRLTAARGCLDQTRAGGDGPLIEPASLLAVSAEADRVAGGLLVTLIPRRAEGEWWDGRWSTPPPADVAAAREQGRPHLTWVFTHPRYAGHGLASLLLAHAVGGLLALGFPDLATTFLVGNDASTLWHWRNGFRLVPSPGHFLASGEP